jgi:hypothetical protein
MTAPVDIYRGCCLKCKGVYVKNITGEIAGQLESNFVKPLTDIRMTWSTYRWYIVDDLVWTDIDETVEQNVMPNISEYTGRYWV